MTRLGITYPWLTVTDQVDTMRPGAITVLMGDTGMGKTSILEQIAAHCSGLAIPFRGAFTEMRGHEIMMRMSGKQLGFDIADVVRQDWDQINADHEITDSREQLAVVYRRLKKALRGVSFYDNKRPTWQNVVEDMNTWADGLDGREGLYALDHLGQFHYDGGKSSESIRETIVHCQENAERRNLHLLLSHQFSRAGRKAMRSLYYPELDWAEGSAGIEQMAHTVLAMTNPLRDEYVNTVKVTAEQVRGGILKYETVVDTSKVNLVCIKSRDLGIRGGEFGRGSVRQLTFLDGEYHTKSWVDLKLEHPHLTYDDSQKLPPASKPGRQSSDMVGPFKRPEAAPLP